MNANLSRILILVLTAMTVGGCIKLWKRGENSTAKTPSERTLNLYIWAEYTSPALLEAFTKKTGIKVVESNFASNEEMLAKLQAGGNGYDVVVPSDYMIAVMIKLGMLAEIPKDRVPNIKNLDAKFLNKEFDPENKFSLPYSWITTGIAVNTAIYKDPVDSWGALFADPKTAGRIALLDDVREVIGAALKFQGKSLNSHTASDLTAAKDLLMKSKARIKTFNSTPIDLITSGEVFVAQMYSNEALIAARDSGKPIQFVIPKEGATLAIDNVAVLKSSRHQSEAWEFINFLFEESSNLEFVTRVLSGPVVNGVREKLPPEIAANAGLFPDDVTLNRCETMQDLAEATPAWDRIWSEFKTASH